MTIVQKVLNFFKKRGHFFSVLDSKNLGIQKTNPFIIIAFLVFFSCLFFILSNIIGKKNKEYSNNFQEISESNEFSNLKNFLLSKINSPYEEKNYIIKNNDTVEKILRKFNIRASDIKNITVKLKREKLANIYSGRKLSLIVKKLEDGTNTLVSLVYPVNNTTSVEIRKVQKNFVVKENILQLYKKEVVVKNIIKDNLYSSATGVGIEPNIIVEFARIFGFEVDFQRDIRKGDWFEILYEKFEDDNKKV